MDLTPIRIAKKQTILINSNLLELYYYFNYFNYFNYFFYNFIFNLLSSVFKTQLSFKNFSHNVIKKKTYKRINNTLRVKTNINKNNFYYKYIYIYFFFLNFNMFFVRKSINPNYQLMFMSYFQDF